MAPDKKEGWLQMFCRLTNLPYTTPEQAEQNLQQEKVTLKSRLKTLPRPDDATLEEGERLNEQEEEIMELIDGALDTARLSFAEDAIEDFEEAIAEVREAATKRTEKVNDIKSRLDQIYDPSKKPESLKDAEPKELTGVENARKAVLDHITPPSDDGIDAADKLVANVATALDVAVKAVQTRLKQEAETIRTNALMTESVGPDAEEAETGPVTKVRKQVTDLLSPDKLDGAAVQAARGLLQTGVQPALVKAREEVRKRLEAAAQVVRGDPLMVEAVSDATADDMNPTAAARLAVTNALAKTPLSGQVVQTAKGLLPGVAAAIKNVKAAVQKRKDDAQKILDGEAMRAAVDGADEAGGDLKDLAAKRLLVKDALKAPLDGTSISTAKERLSQVELAITAVKEVVTKRKEAAAALLNGDAMKAAVDGADEAGGDLKDLADKRLLVTNALKAPLLVTSIAAAQGLLGDVQLALTTAREVVTKRKEEADKLLDGDAMKAVVDGADEAGGDLKDVTDKRQLVKDSLKAPLSGTAVGTAQGLLKDVEAALAAVKEVVVKRQVEADKLLLVVNGDPLKDDPAGALKKQKERLKAARELAIAKLGAKPLSATALAEGKAAKETLEKLHAGVIAAAAKAGGAGVLTQLVTDVGETEIEALEKEFGAEDPEKLVELLTGLGGKDSIKKLLAQFPAADLKKACDALGGAKGAEAVLRVGCGGDAAKMKKMMTAFGTTAEKKDLQELVEKGGLKPDALANVLKSAFDGTADAEKKKKAAAATPPIPAGSVVLSTTEQDTADQAALTQMKSLVTAFKGDDDRKRLANVLEAGGLGGDPAALGTLLQAGCGGDAAKLKKFTDGYPVPDTALLQTNDATALQQKEQLDNLKGLLTTGGVKPEVLGQAFKTGFDAADAKAKKTKSLSTTPATPLATVVLSTTEQDAADQEVLTQMKDLAATFKAEDDQKRLSNLLDAGGLSGNPASLGTLLQTGCGSDSAKLKKFTDGYPVPDPALLKDKDATAVKQKQQLDDLKGVLTKGGLGEDPAVFGGLLAAGCDGDPAKVQTFCAAFNTPADQGTLRDLTRSGLGGEAPERLGNVYKAGLGSDPAKLKGLHAAFNGGPPAGTDLGKFRTVMNSLDAPPPPAPPPLAGDRLQRVTGQMAAIAPPGDGIARLKTHYVDKLTNGVRSGAARATQDKLVRNPAARAAMSDASKAQAMADRPGASAETKNAAAAAKKATEAAGTAALAGAGLDADYVSAATAGAEAARKAAELSVDPAKSGADAKALLLRNLRTESEKKIGASGASLSPTAWKAKVEKEVADGTAAAVLAADKDADDAAAAALLAITTASTTPTPANYKALADAAKAAADAAAKAVDPAKIQAALIAATQAAQAAANAASAAALVQAKAETANQAVAKLTAAKTAMSNTSTAQAPFTAAMKGAAEAITATNAGNLRVKIKAAVKAADAAAAAANAAAAAAGTAGVATAGDAVTAAGLATTAAANALNHANLAGAKASDPAAAADIDNALTEIVKAATQTGVAATKSADAHTAGQVARLVGKITPIGTILALPQAQQKAKGAAQAAQAAVQAAEAAIALTSWAAPVKDLDAAGQAALAATITNDPTAFAAALAAAQAEATAADRAADPDATADEVGAARRAADDAVKLAANAAAAAAKTVVDAAVVTLTTGPVTDALVADAIAAADAASMAAANAPSASWVAAYNSTPAGTATPAVDNQAPAKASAEAAYVAARTQGATVAWSTATSATPPPARTLAGLAMFQARKAESTATLETLLRDGATFDKHPKPTESEGMHGPNPNDLAADNDARMDHYCGRHTREYFTFDEHELTGMDQILKALVTGAELAGLLTTNNQVKNVTPATTMKVTTLFPPGVTKEKVAEYVKTAIAEVNAGHGTPKPTTWAPPLSRASLAGDYLQVKGVQVDTIDGSPLKVTIGFDVNPSNATGIKVMQMYPDPPGPNFPDGSAALVSIDYPDMHAVKDTLGL